MRDPFDSAPALRLGDAPAKRLITESRAARETGIVPNAEIVAIEPPKTDTAIPRPPSLDPAFGDAFGEALSKSKTHRDGLVDWIEKHGAYSVGDGATRYEPAPILKRTVTMRAITIPAPNVIDHGDMSPEAIRANHAALVAKKDAPK